MPLQKPKMKSSLKRKALINLGYVKFSVDIEAVEKALQTKEGKKN